MLSLAGLNESCLIFLPPFPVFPVGVLANPWWAMGSMSWDHETLVARRELARVNAQVSFSKVFLLAREDSYDGICVREGSNVSNLRGAVLP